MNGNLNEIVAKGSGSGNDSRTGSAGGMLIAILDYLAAVLIVLTLNTVLTRTGTVYEHLNAYRLVFSIVLFVIASIRIMACKRSVHTSSLVWLLMVGMLLCISFVANPVLSANVLAFAPIAAAIIFADSLASIEEVRVFLGRFVNIVCALAVVSLFFFVFGSVSHVIAPTGWVLYNWWNQPTYISSYYNLHYDTQWIDFFGYNGVRNTGLYSEAPMFNFVLCTALAANSLIVLGRHWKSLLLAVTVLTTFSTTGYVALVIVVAAVFFSTRLDSRLLSSLRILAVPIVAVFAVLLVQTVLVDKTDTGSYSVRSDHLRGCIELFLSSFPLGVGFGSQEAFFDVFSYEQGLSVGTMYFLAEGGVGAVIIYVIPTLYSFYRGMRAGDYRYAAFIVVLAWLLFVTSVVNGLLMAWVFVALISIRYPSLMQNAPNGARGRLISDGATRAGYRKLGTVLRRLDR